MSQFDLLKTSFRGYGIYLLKEKVVEEFDYPSLEVEKMAKLPIQGGSAGIV